MRELNVCSTSEMRLRDLQPHSLRVDDKAGSGLPTHESHCVYATYARAPMWHDKDASPCSG
jgi:hypothetical protein